MGSLTTEKLGDTRRRPGPRRRPRPPADDDDAPGVDVSHALDENGALVFRDLHLDDDDPGRVQPEARHGGGVVPAPATSRRSSGSRSTPPRTPPPGYLRGTFDWHLDGATDDIPIMATLLERARGRRLGGRDRVLQYVRGVRRPHATTSNSGT